MTPPDSPALALVAGFLAGLLLAKPLRVAWDAIVPHRRPRDPWAVLLFGIGLFVTVCAVVAWSLPLVHWAR